MSELVDRIVKYQAEMGVHRAGSLTMATLIKLDWYLQTYFQDREISSVETGCGASTILFAHYATHHTTYCLDDRSKPGSSVNHALNFPLFRSDRVEWIYGSTQQTILARPPQRPADIVMIDGPHGYPFPELEYFALYKCLRPGAILIVDDIHIPTIHNLYRFLVQDDSFRSHGLTNTTAWFERSDSPAFNMEGDGWWQQRYNVQSFPVVHLDSWKEGARLPISFVFDGTPLTTHPVLVRGFSLLDTPPVSEGLVSNVELRIAQTLPARLRIEMDIEPVCVAEREGSGITVLANGQELGSWDFDSSGRRTIETEALGNGDDILKVEFWNRGLKAGNDLKGWAGVGPNDFRFPNFRLHGIAVADKASDAQPTTLHRADGSVVTFDYEGQPFSFFVDQADDSREVFYTLGRFYELDELEMLRERVPTGASILDVGAHVGNHTIYFERVMGASRIVPIEPHPRAQFLLRTNCRLNELRNVDFSHLGKALGGANSLGSLVEAERYNFGGATVRVGRGPISVCRGDDLFLVERFDLIKIDVEGMELDILAGLSETVARCRPMILIDVKDENEARFAQILEHLRFDVAWQGKSSPRTTNFLISPRITDLLISPSPAAVRLRRLIWKAARAGRHRMRWLPAMPGLESRVRNLLREDSRR